MSLLLDRQVYDTPPSGRWQRPVPSSLADDDIYDTPRSVPPQADSESEVKKRSLFSSLVQYKKEVLLFSGHKGVVVSFCW